jgi:hypothetical protein
VVEAPADASAPFDVETPPAAGTPPEVVVPPWLASPAVVLVAEAPSPAWAVAPPPLADADSPPSPSLGSESELQPGHAKNSAHSPAKGLSTFAMGVIYALGRAFATSQ